MFKQQLRTLADRSSARYIVYSSWWKYLTSSHPHLVRLFTAALQDLKQLPDTTLQFRTLLISKVAKTSADNYRTITIMSNLFKLLRKILLAKVRPVLLENRLISENQGVFGDNII